MLADLSPSSLRVPGRWSPAFCRDHVLPGSFPSGVGTRAIDEGDELEAERPSGRLGPTCSHWLPAERAAARMGPHTEGEVDREGFKMLALSLTAACAASRGDRPEWFLPPSSPGPAAGGLSVCGLGSARKARGHFRAPDLGVSVSVSVALSPHLS